jgi:hypothetical protein
MRRWWIRGSACVEEETLNNSHPIFTGYIGFYMFAEPGVYRHLLRSRILVLAPSERPAGISSKYEAPDGLITLCQPF